jgi:hypothetical protein
MRAGTETGPTAIALPRNVTARAVTGGMELPATLFMNLAEMMRADLDGAGTPGSNHGPVQGTTRPRPRGAGNGARGGG